MQTLFYIADMTVVTACILYYFFVIKPNQDAKNRIKQERKERAEIEQIFNEAPTGFIQRNCEERCYKDFVDTPIMERHSLPQTQDL